MKKVFSSIVLALLILTSCGEIIQTKRVKDNFFGLELGMRSATADSIVHELIKKGEVVNLGYQKNQLRKNEEGEININLYNPTISNGRIESIMYTVQVLENSEGFSEKFKHAMLDDLKQSHGNAKSVKWPKENVSEFKWAIADTSHIDITIDKRNLDEEGEMYTVKYYIKK